MVDTLPHRSGPKVKSFPLQRWFCWLLGSNGFNSFPKSLQNCSSEPMKTFHGTLLSCMIKSVWLSPGLLVLFSECNLHKVLGSRTASPLPRLGLWQLITSQVLTVSYIQLVVVGRECVSPFIEQDGLEKRRNEISLSEYPPESFYWVSSSRSKPQAHSWTRYRERGQCQHS